MASSHSTPTRCQGAALSALDSEERTPLLLAATRSSWSAVSTLVALGADLEPVDKRGRNVVHYIVLNGGKLTELIDSKLVSENATTDSDGMKVPTDE